MKKAISILIILQLAISLRAQISDEPLVRFGVVADVQYDRDTTVGVNGRHYSIDKERLAEAIETFNSRDDLSFTVSLGDIVDRDYVTAFADLKPVLALSKIPVHYVFGNHKFRKIYRQFFTQFRRGFCIVGQYDVSNHIG